MNREIKFRAWDNLNKIMLSWDSFKNIKFDIGDGYETGIPLEILEEKYQKQHNLIPQQFTGLKDKNGVEIYEGDIVRNKRGEFITVVEYYGGAFRCESEGMPLSLYIDECYGDKELNNQLEVVGNVYESKHLINNTEK